MTILRSTMNIIRTVFGLSPEYSGLSPELSPEILLFTCYSALILHT